LPPVGNKGLFLYRLSLCVRIEEKQENDITTYIITVENSKKDPGRYYDVITLKTDNPVKLEFQLSVYGQILETAKNTQ
jgi:hypothetical protein